MGLVGKHGQVGGTRRRRDCAIGVDDDMAVYTRAEQPLRGGIGNGGGWDRIGSGRTRRTDLALGGGASRSGGA